MHREVKQALELDVTRYIPLCGSLSNLYARGLPEHQKLRNFSENKLNAQLIWYQLVSFLMLSYLLQIQQ